MELTGLAGEPSGNYAREKGESGVYTELTVKWGK